MEKIQIKKQHLQVRNPGLHQGDETKVKEAWEVEAHHHDRQSRWLKWEEMDTIRKPLQKKLFKYIQHI